MGKKPNILFLMSDEHRADVTGYEGNRVIRTPNLDRLAEGGISFRSAYTPSPICIPGRQSMMAGQFPRTTGCERYGQDLAPGAMTFARRLSQYGYQTVVSGKLHHMGTDQMQGWTQRIAGDMHVETRYIDGRVEEEFARYQQPPLKWSNAKEIERAGIGRGPCVVHDEYSVRGAVDFIEHYFNSPYYDREQIRPLLLKVSLLQPHYPYLTSEDKFNYYLNRIQPYSDQPVFDHPFLRRHEVKPGRDATERALRRATAAYYGMIETIDGHYGTILSALEHVGQQLDDWIIVYTSDHGEMLGEHGIWEKQKFFEASARVPLVIRYPRKFQGGKVVTENVNLCDLFATLCDLADIPLPSGLDSRSLVPLMQGESADWDNESISQFGGTNLMIKRDRLKYQYYGPGMPEVLFDLEHNPEETINVIDADEYADRVSAFRVRAKELGFSHSFMGGT
jgi:choline-sulfatase